MFNEGYCFELLGLAVWKFIDFPIIISLRILFIGGAIYFHMSVNELSLAVGLFKHACIRNSLNGSLITALTGFFNIFKRLFSSTEGIDVHEPAGVRRRVDGSTHGTLLLQACLSCGSPRHALIGSQLLNEGGVQHPTVNRQVHLT